MFIRIFGHPLTPILFPSEGERQKLLAALLLGAITLAACSPEANRSRSGGAGADVGNRPDPRVQPLPELHPVLNPAYGTPLVGEAVRK